VIMATMAIASEARASEHAIEAPKVAVRSLDFYYGKFHALKSVSLDVADRRVTAFIGPSGCGKSTLLRTVAGLRPAHEGTVTLDGTPVTGVPDHLAVVFQDYGRSLFPWLTVRDNVALPLRRRGLARAERRAEAERILERVGLDGAGRRHPWQLSGGMQQRVAIARGLASRSRLLLLDEPLASVDAQTRADLQDLLLGIAARYGQTCVLVTHDVEEATYMGDRIVVLSKRPTAVAREIAVELPRPRDQIETREKPRFLEIRHEVLSYIRRERGTGAAS